MQEKKSKDDNELNKPIDFDFDADKFSSNAPKTSKRTSQIIKMLEKGNVGNEEITKLKEYTKEKEEVINKDNNSNSNLNPNASVNDPEIEFFSKIFDGEIPSVSFSNRLLKIFFTLFVIVLSVITSYNGLAFLIVNRKKTLAGEFLDNFVLGILVLLLVTIFYRR